MTKHQIFKELFNLTENEMWDYRDLINVVNEAKSEFERVGVPFSYEGFTAYFHRVADPIIQGNNGNYSEKYVRQLKIIEGDNLDKIEDAAKDKGLI
jgi:hypothetical protein